MIYYFSGSGNSKAVAETLASLLKDKYDKIGGPALEESSTLGFVFPVYAWGIAPHILNWLQRVILPKSKPEYIWVVLTYGDEAGMAHKMLTKSLAKRLLKTDAIFGIQMPNTYVLLPGFDIDKEDVSNRKLKLMPERLSEIAQHIRNRNQQIVDLKIGSLPKLKSNLVFPLFKIAGIKASRWQSDPTKCIGCGLCERVCPMHNIAMTNQKPVCVYEDNGAARGLDLKGGNPKWEKECSSCLACYHACPEHAINYGKITLKKGQWRHWFK